MTRPRQSITLSLSQEEKLKLEELALFFDCRWGDQPNISKLLKMIALGQIALIENGNPIAFNDRPEFEKKIQELKLIAQYLEKL